MTRYRMYPTDAQQDALLTHCAHARYVWNLAVEQQSWWTRYRGTAPTSAERYRQLTEARAASDWLRSGSVNVQQQALRDFDQAQARFFAGTHRRPTWRSARKGHNGFRITDTARTRRLNRRWAEVKIPKIGWVRFRWTRPLPAFKSFRVTLDRAGRWHVAFAAIPEPIPAPGNGQIIGIDRGVAHAATLSDGTHVDFDSSRLDRKIRTAQRELSRTRRGSNRRTQAKNRLARLHARRADSRKDYVEKATTGIARSFDLIRMEALNVKQMTASAKGTVEQPGRNVAQKAGLNRGILDKGWAAFAQRLEHKAKGRVEYVPAAYTSQRCSTCGEVDPKSRESQAVFRCRTCGHTANADVNAAINIAAGHAVTARGGSATAGPSNREPQPS